MRKGVDRLAVLVQQPLEQSPHGAALFAFCGKRGDLVKLLWTMARGCAYSRSEWTGESSSGHRQRRTRSA